MSSIQYQTSSSREQETIDAVDLIGGPWAVIESDPGVFTMLMQKLGVRGCEATEIYSLDAESLRSIGRIYGFILCSTYQDEEEPEHPQEDVEAQFWSQKDSIWFANQLITDACATQGLLNVLFNCPDIQLGDHLQRFRDFTQELDPQMKGLAMSNDKDLRNAHNSMARPADVREALSSIAIETSKLEKKKSTQRSARSSSRKKKTETTTQDVYHYIGFVPSNGKVWQLDGLVSGPLEVGNLPQGVQLDTPESQKSWLTLVQPAITLQIEKMQSHGGDIRVNLLAITNSLWEKYSDEFELLRRERRALERRLNAEVKDWSAKSKENDPSLTERANSLFDGPNSHHSSPFDTAFGLRAQEKQMKVLQLPSDALLENWRQVVDRAGELKALLEEEISKAKRWQSEYIKRTHDYEPFLRELLSALKSEGILDARLNE